ncbi:MAG: hypothetical protein V3U54_08430 [Thermodesulfobacteriota bacterium]
MKEKVQDFAYRLYKFEGKEANRKIPRHDSGSGVMFGMWMESTIEALWSYLRSEEERKDHRTKMVKNMYDTFQNLAIIEAVEDWVSEINELRYQYQTYLSQYKEGIDLKYVPKKRKKRKR